MTAQIGEYLRYQGQGHTIATEPLQSYFNMGGQHPGFMDTSTALWRGYVGCWEIVGGRLYLVKITAELNSGGRATLESVFPGFPDRVFAHWFSGQLRIPRGKRLHDVHMGYSSVYEYDEFLEFEHGVLRKSWIKDNTQSSDDQGLEGGAA